MERSDTHISLVAYAAAFCLSENAFEDHNLPVYERWGYILAWVPETRTKGLLHDYSATFENALTSNNGQTVYAAAELADLQSRFYRYVWENGLTFWHVGEATYVQSKRWSILLRMRVGQLMEYDTPGKLERNEKIVTAMNDYH